jgi:maltooligosyltrehalose trehalohydrolase
MMPGDSLLGAVSLGDDRTAFRVWAPAVASVTLELSSPAPRRIRLEREADGYHAAVVSGVPVGSEYRFGLDGRLSRPDPASRWQPLGVHGPSRVVDSAYAWGDERWKGRPLREYVVYELHVGTFTPEGTLAAAAAHLPALRDLGVTAVELMPVAQFPGTRNWGYDGVYPFAVQDSYGGPLGLRQFVDAAHAADLAVVLDVVYNHLGPEGNYLADFGPYFTDRYRTPWGRALNFDGADSDGVRDFFLANAAMWQTEFHLDALRLDAVHAIRDFSAVAFLEELAETTRGRAERLGRAFYLIAESDLNLARHIVPRDQGGYGLDAQWSDDFHHVLHVLLTGESAGYYADYRGGVSQLAKVWREGYAYTGEYSAYRRRRHGSSPAQASARQFVVCAQNHDQIGNRRLGDRLAASLTPSDLRLAAAAVLFSPFIPLLFMGEEYGEIAPFQYFVSHGDPALVEAVRRGRREEFAAFGWRGEVPDPQAESTWQQCQLNRQLAAEMPHRGLLEFYRECLRLRRLLRPLVGQEKDTLSTRVHGLVPALLASSRVEGESTALLLHFGSEPVEWEVALGEGRWVRVLDSEDHRWGGAGSGMPAELEAKAESVRLTLAPRSAVLWHQPRLPGRWC